MTTPQLHLETLHILNDQGRIVSTREPGPSRGPLFMLVRGATNSAWAVHADIPQALADELDQLACEEPPILDLRAAPMHADRYTSLLGRHLAAGHEAGHEAEATPRLFAGPAFIFPNRSVEPANVDSIEIVRIEDERLLEHNFRGWVPGEIAAGRGPMVAVVVDGFPVSICFCARRSGVAAEAGLETAEAYRGRGYGPLATAAWAQAIRALGRIPLYSTSWSNDASLSVARKLGLVAYASGWSLSNR